MIKRLVFTFTTVILLLFAGCSTEIPLNDKEQNSQSVKDPKGERVISFNASVPGTRIALTQDGLNVLLTWEVGDKIQLCFVQGDVKVKKTVTVKNISTDKRSVQFDIVLPDEIQEGEFDLYGVYGGEGLSDSNPTMALLPLNAGTSGSLDSVQDREDVMLYFSQKSIQTSNPNATVLFKHLGSLFCISLKNTGVISFENLGEVRLISGTSGWAYNNGTGGNSYDLITETFQNTESAGNYISFKAIKPTIDSGEVMSFWAWYPPLPSVNWPELTLELRDESGSVIATSANVKPMRTAPTPQGRSFYIYAAWDGHTLEFTDENFWDGNVIQNGGFEDPINPHSLLPTVHGFEVVRPVRASSFFSTTSMITFPELTEIVNIPDYTWFHRTSSYHRWHAWNYVEPTNLANRSNEIPNSGDKSMALYISSGELKSYTNDYMFSLAQRVELDDNKKYKLSFYVQKDTQCWGAGDANKNYAEKINVGIVSSDDADKDYTYYITFDLPAGTDWTKVDVPLDLPAIIASNPGKSFAKSAIFISLVPTQFNASNSTYKHQVNVDDVSLKIVH